MTIPLKTWTRMSVIRAADLNRMVEAIRRATPVAGKGISVSQSLAGSVISLSGNGGPGASAGGGGDYPFKIKRVNSGTMENPAWHTIVYIPSNAISVASLTEASRYEVVCDTDDTQEYDHANMPGWYEYERNDGFGVVGLQLKIAAASAGGTYRCYFRLAEYGSGVSGWLPQYSNNYGTQEIALGVVAGSGVGEVYNLVRSGVWTSRMNFFGGGQGSGTLVSVLDQRTDKSSPGIVGLSGASADGSVVLVVTDASSVKIANGVSLGGYLSGGTEWTGAGKNINTDNFPDECLGPALTPNADEGDPNLAAPSIHKHTLDQLEDEEGNAPFSDAESLMSFFSNLGMWDELGETGPSGDGPSDNSLLTVGDILTDEVMLEGELKRDAAVPVAGDPSTDLLVLSGHRHPLNVADLAMATGPSGEEPTPPPAADYVLPVGVGTTGPSGVASPSSAGFGVQPFYARVDHIHPICDDMGPTGLVTTGDVGPSGGMAMPWSDQGDFGPTGAPTGVTLDQHTWTPGEQGYEESYCCRILKVGSGITTTRYAIFRKRKVSRTGAVVWVGPEYIGFIV